MNASLLIERIEAHSRASGLKPSTICTYAGISGRLYRDLRAGKSCTLRTAQRLLDWLDRHADASAPVNQDNAPVTGLQPERAE